MQVMACAWKCTQEQTFHHCRTGHSDRDMSMGLDMLQRGFHQAMGPCGDLVQGLLYDFKAACLCHDALNPVDRLHGSKHDELDDQDLPASPADLQPQASKQPVSSSHLKPLGGCTIERPD